MKKKEEAYITLFAVDNADWWKVIAFHHIHTSPIKI